MITKEYNLSVDKYGYLKDVLFYVTTKEKFPAILENGRIFNSVDDPSLFAYNNFWDAVKWVVDKELIHRKDLGSGDYVILYLRQGDEWESTKYCHSMKGRWYRARHPVNTSTIIDTVFVDRVVLERWYDFCSGV
tara:strand:- start:484 stop:885 length:402 start_codon:yes stop_codon:yes gene_type:complete